MLRGLILTMWLKSQRDSLVALHPDEIEERVEFSENGLAQCKRDVGEQLLEMYPFIEEHEPEE